MTTARSKVFIELLKLLFGGGFSGGDELFVRGGGGGGKKIWWGDTPQQGKPCYPLRKSKEEKLFLQS